MHFNILIIIVVIHVLSFKQSASHDLGPSSSINTSTPDERSNDTCDSKFTAEEFADNPFKFLKERVFGQKSADSSDDFLSMLDADSDGHHVADSNQKSAPFLGILEQLGKINLFPGKDPELEKKRIESTTLVQELLKKAAVVREEETAVEGLELLNRITSSLQEAIQQLHHQFGPVFDSFLDAYLPFVIIYFLQHQAARFNPMWKRRMHRFFTKVKKQELAQLHEALYLSTLAYVDTVDNFRTGLSNFDNGSWELMFGTTNSLPNLPANFLLIHKELAPLEEPTFPSFLFGKKESEVVVVLVVRGTKDLPDTISDALLKPQEYKGGFAHGGILASGRNLAEYYLPKLEDIHKASGRDKVRVICMGHSLGAGAAAIAAMELREHDFLKVEAVGFGCPSLLSKDLADSTKDFITTVVNDADIIPRMSGASMTNLVLDLFEYDWTDDALDDVKFTLSRAKETFSFGHVLPDVDTVLNWVADVLTKEVRPKYQNLEKRDRLPSLLIPPGTCIHTFRDGYGFSATYVPCRMFESVEFSLTLIDDHMISSGYNRAMLGAAQDIDREYSFKFQNDPNSIVGLT
ncbi:lipase class 3 [Nitzschia inconspicua]|uniref:Lipase class 3 n=1 Tax=Nitzschia inconspicua TaxID=303405 RepID=A0A9K3L767_9STRA|nr:lipase class 3 [Nitzschia inconspicua]